MRLPSIDEIESAAERLAAVFPATPQISWPLLNERLGCETWVKHENHTPLGAFKIRGAFLYVSWLKQSQPDVRGVVAATRGNHGQGVAYAAARNGIASVIVVPRGNSVEKNAAMRALGAELIEHGEDFQESLEFARKLSTERGYPIVESFHPQLMLGTASYGLEFFKGTPELDTVYVPIGLGSSICGVVAAREALGLKTCVVGVVSSLSPSYALSFKAGKLVESPSTSLLGDGLSCRRPNEQALELIGKYVEKVIEVTDEELAEAIRIYLVTTHNLAEGAGAAALAGALKSSEANQGKRIGIVLTGGNIDQALLARVLNREL
jgi:threonine dehydratase